MRLQAQKIHGKVVEFHRFRDHDVHLGLLIFNLFYHAQLH